MESRKTKKDYNFWNRSGGNMNIAQKMCKKAGLNINANSSKIGTLTAQEAYAKFSNNTGITIAIPGHWVFVEDITSEGEKYEILIVDQNKPYTLKKKLTLSENDNIVGQKVFNKLILEVGEVW